MTIPPDLSTSSAYDPESYDRPTLAANVHGLLTQDDISNFSLSRDVEFRSVVSNDELDEIRQLHYEWFPVMYNDEFYNSIVTGGGFGGGDVITVLACMRADVIKVIGVITIAIRRNEKQYNPTGDLMPELGFPELNGSLEESASSPFGENPTLGYILTLGVVDELRRHGIGAALLEEGIRRVEEADTNCCAVFLHVIEYNQPAMNFYLRHGFKNFSRYDNFYFFDDKVFAGILFYRRISPATVVTASTKSSISAVSRLSAWVYKKLKKIFQFMRVHVVYERDVSCPKRSRILDTSVV
jgi:ribosomal protein S18 acetylase RimI-like enzyme